MTTITAIKDGQNNRYIRSDFDNRGHEILHRECEFRIMKARSKSGYDYTLIDDDGQTYPDFHRFINIHLVNQGRGINTRRAYAHILCKFHSFLYLTGYNIHNLYVDEILRLREFFKGSGDVQCCNESVNTYLTVVRSYLNALDIKCEALSATHNIFRNILELEDFSIKGASAKYDVSMPTNPHKLDNVPKYISFDEYIALQHVAQEAKDWNAIILMHLMFRYGMRIGECLGLTEEDITTSRIRGKDIPTLILRNRISDSNDQRAKRRYIPLTTADYDCNTYVEQWKKDDYSHIYLTESEDTEFVHAFEKFVRQSREEAESTHPQNYRQSEADIVYPSEFKKKGLKKNHYIFVNHLGKPLSAQVWGKTLKRYFIQVGIPVDSGKKANNLSHRFRHGFAMMHARFMDPTVSPHELQKMMRHRQLNSTMVYYNPTQEDEYEYKTALQNKFYDNNMELKAIMSDFLSSE